MKDSSTGWYIVYTKPRQESFAMLNLEWQRFQGYLPLLQEHRRRRNLYQIITEPLFPRYLLFMCLNTSTGDWSTIRSTCGCVSLVRFGTLPVFIPSALIEQLKQEQKRLAQDTYKKTAFKPGNGVRIIDGLLTDYEGIIETKNNQERITLLLTISEGYTKRINLSLHEVKTVN